MEKSIWNGGGGEVRECPSHPPFDIQRVNPGRVDSIFKSADFLSLKLNQLLSVRLDHENF